MINILLTWSLVGALLGFVFIGVLPWVTAKMIGVDAVEKVSSWYVWLAQNSISKSALIIRPGSVDLVNKTYDPDQKADKDTAGGEPRHHRDTLGALRSMANKPFGLALHDVDEYVTPLLAEIGDHAKERVEREEIGAPIDSESKTMLDGIPVSGKSNIVDVRGAKHLVTGDADPEDGHRSYQKTVISQEKFHERMTFGQTLILVGSFLASAALLWLLASQDAPSTGSVVSLSIASLPFGDKMKEALGKIDWSTIGAILFAALMVVSVPIIAFLTHGIIAGALVAGVSFAVAVGYATGIALFGPSLPGFLGTPLAKLNWTLAQLCVGRGVLVERDTGEYEHHQLVEDETGEYDWTCRLDDGNWLGINGSVGDMVRFGWEPLAITAEKSAENLGNITSHPPDGARTDGGTIRPDNTRRGWQPEFTGDAVEADWMVTLPQLWKWCQGSAESESIREGRDTALTQQGGQQQISYTIYVVLLVFSMVLGGAFGLVAGGGI